jgi:hypothetical protein
MPRFQEEYLPPVVFKKVAPSFLVSSTLGGLLAAALAVVLPPDTGTTDQQWEDCTSWRYIYGFAIIPLSITLIICLTFITTESPKYYLM